jgi:hypothetical protein
MPPPGTRSPWWKVCGVAPDTSAKALQEMKDKGIVIVKELEM